ncbi:MAG: hypothetical protein ABDI20_08420 [Candidatus Bipolaricaulaceae bacterium]
MRLGLFLILALILLGLTSPRGAAPAAPPSRLLVLGLPAWGPSWLEHEGRRIPAGCGPEAARLLLWYWDACRGLDLVRPAPQRALAELHRLMGTVTVLWEGVEQGLTWPWKFAQGLEAYVRAALPAARVHTLGAPLDELFQKAVELLARGNLPVLLFDWEGRGGLLPNHYALVVGYDLKERVLVVNPGWGYPFQLVPLADPEVGPGQLFWLEGPGLAPAPTPLPAPPAECPRVRAYGKNAGFLPWCGARRAEGLGPGLIRLVWD